MNSSVTTYTLLFLLPVASFSYTSSRFSSLSRLTAVRRSAGKWPWTLGKDGYVCLYGWACLLPCWLPQHRFHPSSTLLAGLWNTKQRIFSTSFSDLSIRRDSHYSWCPREQGRETARSLLPSAALDTDSVLKFDWERWAERENNHFPGRQCMYVSHVHVCSWGN